MTDEVAVAERPTPAEAVEMMDRELVTTYRDVCAQIGVVNPSILIEDFRHFLNQADLPVFDLASVAAFMDNLTARDNPSKLGWQWLPVRERDRIEHRFGRPAVVDYDTPHREYYAKLVEVQRHRKSQRGFFGGLNFVAPPVPPIATLQPIITPASDYCAGPDAQVYDRDIPIHALKKIARIEQDFGVGKVAFFITDYVTEPHVVINPDPFLMAIMPNKQVGKGVGRFVIDVWDEPGFGIAQMLK